MTSRHPSFVTPHHSKPTFSQESMLLTGLYSSNESISDLLFAHLAPVLVDAAPFLVDAAPFPVGVTLFPVGVAPFPVGVAVALLP